MKKYYNSPFLDYQKIFIQSSSLIKKEEEFLLAYSLNKSNFEYLLYYGFILSDNDECFQI